MNQETYLNSVLIKLAMLSKNPLILFTATKHPTSIAVWTKMSKGNFP